MPSDDSSREPIESESSDDADSGSSDADSGSSDATGESSTDAGSDAAAAARADAERDGIEERLAGGDDRLGSPSDALQNPTDNVPTPEAPSVETDAPEAPEPDDVPEGLRAEFWELVFAANVALFGLALGAMLVGFGENVPLGILAMVVGAAATVFLAYRYTNRQHTP